MNAMADAQLVYAQTPMPHFHESQTMQFCSLLLKAAASTGLAGLLVFSTAVHCQERRTGTIKAVIGDVFVVRGESRQPMRVGDPVVELDRISTGTNSATSFALRDGTIISVGSNSALDVTSFQFEPTKQEGSMAIGLVSGSMRFITGLLGNRDRDRIRISTPTATVGIRGTDFILEAE